MSEKYKKTCKHLNYVEFLTSKSLINWYISHDEFVSMNNVLREYN